MTDPKRPSPEDPAIALRRAALQASILASPRFAAGTRLAAHGAKYFSQGDEDGIVAAIFARLGEGGRSFVEIGIGDGSENNTLHLLMNGWRGVWVDASAEGVAAAHARFSPLVEAGRLAIVHARVDPGNVSRVLREAGVPTQPDLFCIDIDGNDYHVFEALEGFAPRAAVLEYNASLGPTARWSMPFDPDHRWDESLVFGASLTALTELANEKGMELVGCNLPGTNAFFVSRHEDLARFQGPFTAVEHYEPPRYYLLPMHGGHRAPGPGDARMARGLLERRSR
jgi:hypothetical protein